MADNKMLSQEEIDALLNASTTEMPDAVFAGEDMTAGEDQEAMFQDRLTAVNVEYNGTLSDNEKDSLGEIGNISMGTAATALSEILGQRVFITSPTVSVISQEVLFNSFEAPYIFIKVEYIEGLEGFNMLVINLKDAMIMANIMMGGDGTGLPEEIGEIEISAASEAMNQMAGSAATSLATMFSRTVNISPPQTIVQREISKVDFDLPSDDKMVVVISFRMKIGDLVDSRIMQVLKIETAKKEALLLWQNMLGEDVVAENQEDSWLSRDIWSDQPAGDSIEKSGFDLSEIAVQFDQKDEVYTQPPEDPVMPFSRQDAAVGSQSGRAAQSFSFPGLNQLEQKKMELLLEVPLRVSVVLGRTKRPIKEVLNLTPGSIVELSSLVDEPVEILVNGTLVANGEVVVVNENFGVRIINIVSLEERLRHLGG